MFINYFIDNSSEATSDPYRVSLLRKNRFFALMTGLGLLMIAAATLNFSLQFAPNADSVMEFYCGIGSALTAVSLIKLFLNRRLLRNESFLKKARLQYMDERNLALNSKSTQSAAGTVLIGCYLAMLIGGLYNMTIFWCFWSVIILFLFAYCIYFRYYQTKM